MKGNSCTRALAGTLACLALLTAVSLPASEDMLTISPASGSVTLTKHFANPPFKRLWRPPALRRVQTGLGHGWRHDYDLVLTRTGDTVVIFDARGQRHTFRRSGATSPFRALDETPGSRARLRQRGHRHDWTRTSGEIVQFDRGVPTRIDHPVNGTTRLRYQDGLLVSVTADHHPRLTLDYERGQLRRVLADSGTVWHLKSVGDGALTISASTATTMEALTDEHLCEPDDPDPVTRQCDTDASPPPASFTLASERAAASATATARHVATTWVDARPASCRSYFVDYVGTDRGVALELGLADQDHYAGYQATVRSFPIVDFIGEELRVVRSRDLARPSYDGDGLYQTLLNDGEDIERLLLGPLRDDESITVRESGRVTTLTREPARPIILEVVIRHGIASAAQWNQLQRAGEVLRTRHGIQLRVIEIP